MRLALVACTAPLYTQWDCLSFFLLYCFICIVGSLVFVSLGLLVL